MGWLITLGILTLLAILPLGVSVKYNADGPLVRLILGPVRMTVVPAKKKSDTKKKKKPKKKAEEKPVKQIGKEVGFNHVNHFIQHFKRITGLTPGEYPLLHRG